jgi:hypothetical protein
MLLCAVDAFHRVSGDQACIRWREYERKAKKKKMELGS